MPADVDPPVGTIIDDIDRHAAGRQRGRSQGGTELPEEATRFPATAGGAWSSAGGPLPSLGTASASAPERSAAGWSGDILRRLRHDQHDDVAGLHGFRPHPALRRQAELPSAGGEGVFGKQHPFAALVGCRPSDRPAAVEHGNQGMGFRPAGDHGVALRVDPDDVEGGHGTELEAWNAAGICGGVSSDGGMDGAACWTGSGFGWTVGGGLASAGSCSA